MNRIFKLTLKLVAIGLTVVSISCSDDVNLNESASSNHNITRNSKGQIALTATQHQTTLKAFFLKDNNNRTSGDFTNVEYLVENYAGNVLLSDKMECIADEKSINCTAVTNLNELKPAIYRILIKSGDGLLGSDLFEIVPNLIPVVITIDNESTGYYLISVIGQQTGFHEDEVHKRVSHILSIEEDRDFDLEITLYDLLMYYGGSRDFSQALRTVIEKLQKDEPVTINGQDGVSGSANSFN